MKIYITGDITNPNAKAQFEKAKETLLELNKGYQPISPMDLPHKHSKSWNAFMQENIKAMMDCQGIYLLQGWHESVGTVIQKELACNLSFKIIYELNVD
jgi:nucleoside 2-deoxyribosyltransferase